MNTRVSDMTFRELDDLTADYANVNFEEAWKELVKRIELAKIDDDMMMNIIEENIGLLKTFAYKYSKISSISEYDDCLSIATFGLIQAVQTFERGKRCKFSKWLYLNIQASFKSFMFKEVTTLNNNKSTLSITNDEFELGSNTIQEDLIDDGKDPFEVVSRKMDVELVKKTMEEKLTKKERRALQLKYFRDLKQKDACKVMGVSQNNFNSTCEVARKKIKLWCGNKIDLS